MTKQEFLEGKAFYVGGKRYKGESTHFYDKEVGCISKQSRSSTDEKIIVTDYACNIKMIGRTGFIGFTYVMSKLVRVKYKFEELSVFVEEGI